MTIRPQSPENSKDGSMIPQSADRRKPSDTRKKYQKVCHSRLPFAYCISMKLGAKSKYGVIGLIVMLVGAGIAFMCMNGGDKPSDAGQVTLEKNADRTSKKNSFRRLAKKRKNAKGTRVASEKDFKLVPREKPSMLLDDEEEKELTDLARKVLASLQAALDSEDFNQIRQILEMAQRASKGSLGRYAEGMPVALRKKLIEAISWFGAQGLPELIGFIADENEEVAQMALDQFEQALSDVSLGDRERAKIVALASTVLTDTDALEQIFMEISNMRNSVAANTLFTIWQDGTPEAKRLLADTIAFVTGEDNIMTVEDLERWLAQNPDGPDDEDLYGPMDVD